MHCSPETLQHNVRIVATLAQLAFDQPWPGWKRCQDSPINCCKVRCQDVRLIRRNVCMDAVLDTD